MSLSASAATVLWPNPTSAVWISVLLEVANLTASTSHGAQTSAGSSLSRFRFSRALFHPSECTNRSTTASAIGRFVSAWVRRIAAIWRARTPDKAVGVLIDLQRKHEQLSPHGCTDLLICPRAVVEIAGQVRGECLGLSKRPDYDIEPLLRRLDRVVRDERKDTVWEERCSKRADRLSVRTRVADEEPKESALHELGLPDVRDRGHCSGY